MLNSRSFHSNLKYRILCLAVTCIFCLACLIVSALTPRVGFEVGVQGSGLVVKHVTHSNDDIQSGDIIESVSGKPVHSQAAFYFQLLHSGNDADLTIKRTGSLFQRPMTANEFSNGALPFGLHANDIPISIADESGNYSPLESVDLQTLRSILESRNGAVSVIFKRQDELLNVSVSCRDAIARTTCASLILLCIALMGLAVWQESRKRRHHHPIFSTVVLGLGSIGLMTLGLWSVLLSYPIIFMFGIIGLTLFKVVDFDSCIISKDSKA